MNNNQNEGIKQGNTFEIIGRNGNRFEIIRHDGKKTVIYVPSKEDDE